VGDGGKFPCGLPYARIARTSSFPFKGKVGMGMGLGRVGHECVPNDLNDGSISSNTWLFQNRSTRNSADLTSFGVGCVSPQVASELTAFLPHPHPNLPLEGEGASARDTCIR
jgi:hypothetical protein